jgi:hypothetical protein
MNSARRAALVCALGLASTLLVGCHAPSTGSASAAKTTLQPASSSAPASTAPATAASTNTKASASLSWVAPTVDTDGSPLMNLAGYHIYYGTNQYDLNQKIDVANAGADSYVVTGLAPGTWYFAVTAYTNTGVESALSIIQSKTVT